MNKIKHFVALLLLTLSIGTTNANDIITITTNAPIGEKISFSIGADNDQVTITGATSTDAFSGYMTIEYTVEQPTITIKSDDTNKLLSINAQACYISAIDLTQAPNLTSCKLDNNELTSLDVSTNTALTTLYCQYNNLDQLDVTPLTKLKYLACSHNNLTVLNVSNNTEIRELYCFNNNIEVLDVTSLRRLGKLSCASNKISALDTSNAGISLTQLFCADNNLKTLDVSNNDWLFNLGCSGNQIEEIDLSKNTDLEIIFLDNNPINHQIDLSKLTKLTEVYIGNTGQDAIDVSKNLKLATLSCSNNNISELDITANTKIRFLYLQDNNFSGTTMSNIIDQLPTMTETRRGQIIVKDAEKEDRNVCYVADVEKAISKNWIVGQYQNGGYVAFNGDPNASVSQVLMASVSCVLDNGILSINGAVAGDDITVYGFDGKVLATGKTDDSGSLSMPLSIENPYVIVKAGQSGTFKIRR